MTVKYLCRYCGRGFNRKSRNLRDKKDKSLLLYESRNSHEKRCWFKMYDERLDKLSYKELMDTLIAYRIWKEPSKAELKRKLRKFIERNKKNAKVQV